MKKHEETTRQEEKTIIRNDETMFVTEKIKESEVDARDPVSSKIREYLCENDSLNPPEIDNIIQKLERHQDIKMEFYEKVVLKKISKDRTIMEYDYTARKLCEESEMDAEKAYQYLIWLREEPELAQSYLEKRNEFLRLKNALYRQALDAKTYASYINQFPKYLKKYGNAMSSSTCFWRMSYASWITCMFIELGKLYEFSRRTNGINSLIDRAKELSENEFSRHTINSVDYQCETVAINNTNMPFIKDNITIRMSFKDVVDQCEIQLNELKEIINNMWEQRCKFYAHNDKKYEFDIHKIAEKYPFNHDNAEKLINFALTTTRLFSQFVTGNCKSDRYGGEKDLEIMLMLAEKGEQDNQR